MNQRSKISALLCIAMFSSTVGSSAALSASSNQTTTGVPVVADARNSVIGPAYAQGVIVSIGGTNVYVDTSHSADFANFSATNLSWGLANAVYQYPTSDCSGPPWVDAGVALSDYTVTPFTPAIAVRNGSTVTLYIAGTSPPSLQQVNSRGSPIIPGDCSTISYQILAYSVATTVNLTQLHPEPLHVR
jgi:hypothetical protein